MKEPLIRVGISEGKSSLNLRLNGRFRYRGRALEANGVAAGISNGQVAASLLYGYKLIRTLRSARLRFVPEAGSSFALKDVRIGIGFHWEKEEEQLFGGLLEIKAGPGGLTAINEIGLEEYLASVISSEMSATAPFEFLKAHAIASRSWLGAMLMRKKRPRKAGKPRPGGEVVKWYDREDHEGFDVCADDHCQRYQGLSRIISENAARAAAETAGIFLVHDGSVCDARYYKACGGITENFRSAWEDVDIPYLSSLADSALPHAPVSTEADFRRWVFSRPKAYCNTDNRELLSRILPEYDRGTNFFRWTAACDRQELEEILLRKSGIDFGTLESLEPLARGPSGRIFRLRIKGSKREIVVGKELEIRRWLSPSHLLSSAFVVDTEKSPNGPPSRFVFTGAGWGHGVGMCQVGAAVMASRGFSCAEILTHYFRGARLEKLYEAGKRKSGTKGEGLKAKG